MNKYRVEVPERWVSTITISADSPAEALRLVSTLRTTGISEQQIDTHRPCDETPEYVEDFAVYHWTVTELK